MRQIEWTTQFKRDYKREKKGRHRASLDQNMVGVITLLANNKPLDNRYRDHALTGNWKDHRDCHIKPDLVLIYRITNQDILQLVRLGSHAELSL